VNPDGASAEFDAVEDKVVVLSADGFGVGVEELDVFRDGGGEGVVSCGEFAFFLIIEHEGEFDDPVEIVLVVGDGEFFSFDEELCGFEADAAQDSTGTFPFGSGEEDDVAFFDFEAFFEGGFFFFREEFEDG